MSAYPRPLSAALSIALVLGCVGGIPGGMAASTFGPTVLVNTEAFTVIDDSDATANVVLKFGDALAKTITYNRTTTRFEFNDSVSVTGTLRVTGTMTGANLTVSNLVNCDTIDTNASGIMTCGTDGGGGGGIALTDADARYTNTSGDTMTGALRISNSAGLNASGTVLTNTDITLNSDNGAADAVLTFGNATTAQTLKYLHSQQKFSFSKSVRIIGNISGSTLTIDGNGQFNGGTFVVDAANKKVGVRNLAPETELEVSGSMSGRLLHAQDRLESSGSLVVNGNTAFNKINYLWPGSPASASGKVLKVNPATGQLSWSADSTGAGGGPSTVVSTANVADSTTGGTNTVTGLTVPVSANTNYIIRCLLTTSAAAATTGVQITVNGPAAPTQVTWTRQSCSSATALVHASINAFGTEDARTASAGATRCMESINIHLRNGANAGNVTFSVDTEVAASAATVHTGSFCDYQSY